MTVRWQVRWQRRQGADLSGPLSLPGGDPRERHHRLPSKFMQQGVAKSLTRSALATVTLEPLVKR